MDSLDIIKLISVVVVIMVIIFICLETLFRIFRLGIHWDIDEFGSRESLHNRNITDSGLRIVCVGDSLTFGTRLQERDSYPLQLKEKLRNHLGSDLDVRNAGIAGHTSIQVLERIERDVFKFRPHIVVVWIGTNDGMLKKTADPLSERPFDRPPVLTQSVLLTTVYSLEWIMPIVNFLHRPYGTFRDLTPRVSIDDFNRTLMGILHKLKISGITKIIILNIPIIPEHFMSSSQELIHRQRDLYTKYNDIIADAANTFNVHVLDMTNILSNKKRRIFLKDGLHLTPYGCDVVAEAVSHKIMSLLNIS